MQQAWHIFRKDLRHLWPYAAVWVAVVAIWLLARPVTLFVDQSLSDRVLAFFDLLAPVSLFVLIAQLVHQEALPGTTQFWLARPYAWRSLLGAKLLFLLLCVHLPLLVVDLLCLARNGLDASAFLGDLLSQHLTIFLVLGLASMAVAALTRNLGQFALVALGAFAGMIFTLQFFSGFTFHHWGALNWIPSAATACTVGSTAAAVTVLQYGWRRTMGSAILACAGLALGFTAISAMPWSVAMGLQSLVSPSQPRALQIRLAGPRQSGKDNYNLRPGFVRFRLPVTIDGLEGRDLTSHNMTVRLPGYDSAWAGEGHLDRSDESTWVHVFDLPRATYLRHQQEPLRLEWTASVSTFLTLSDHAIPVGPEATTVPGLGRCAAREQPAFNNDNQFQVVCARPPTLSERVLIRAEKDGVPCMPWRIFHRGTSGPSMEPSIHPLRAQHWGWFGPRAEPTKVIFRRLRLDSTFPVSWRYEGIKLAEYVAVDP